MGEAAHVLGTQPHPPQQIGHALFPYAPAPHAVHEQRLAHDVEQGHARIQGGERILENHLHLAPERTQLGPRQLAHVDDRAIRATDEDLAGG